MSEIKDNTNPSYYKDYNIQVIDAIQAWNLNFCRGNVIKYVVRAGKKYDELLDLRKARQYLDFEIDRLEKETNGN